MPKEITLNLTYSLYDHEWGVPESELDVLAAKYEGRNTGGGTDFSSNERDIDYTFPSDEMAFMFRDALKDPSWSYLTIRVWDDL